MRRLQQPENIPQRFPLFRIAAIVVTLLICAFVSSGCTHSNGADAQQSGGGNQKSGRGGGGRSAGGGPQPVGVSPVRKQDVQEILTGLGTATAYNTVTVHSRVDGQLVKVGFREGQTVKPGDLLAVIDPRPFEVAVQQAQAALQRDQAQYNTAVVNLQRAQQLVKEGIYAPQQLDTQKAETGQLEGTIKVDQANLENAKLNLSYTSIKSPVNGRVGLRLVDQGNMVHANDQQGMLVITQTKPIAVLFTLPEDTIQRVEDRLHAAKTLSVDAYDRDDVNKIATGRLETIDNQIDPTTGTVRLKAVFDNKDDVLWPNQFVNVHLQIQTLKDVLVIPSAAVQRGQQNSTFVYTVDDSNTAQLKNIQIALTQGDTTVVQSGLQAGDRVVTDGQDRLQAGMKVDPTAAQQRGQRQAGAGRRGGADGQASPAQAGSRQDAAPGATPDGQASQGRSGVQNGGDQRGPSPNGARGKGRRGGS